MCSRRSTYGKAIVIDSGAGCNWHRVTVPLPGQPARDRRRRVERNVTRKSVEGVEREMIRVCVRKENRVEPGQSLERDPGRTHPRKESAERIIEIRVGE